MSSAKNIKAFAKHINELRQEKGLSLQALANQCEMDKGQVQKICNGSTDPRMSTLIRLAKGLGVSEGELFNFKK